MSWGTLEPMKSPLAAVVARWRGAPPWQRRLVRIVSPGVARALDRLADAVARIVGLP